MKTTLSTDRKARHFTDQFTGSRRLSVIARPLSTGQQRRLLEAEARRTELDRMIAQFEEDYGEDVEWVE